MIVSGLDYVETTSCQKFLVICIIKFSRKIFLVKLLLTLLIPRHMLQYCYFDELFFVLQNYFTDKFMSLECHLYCRSTQRSVKTN